MSDSATLPNIPDPELPPVSDAARKKMEAISLLVCDVDGVLTNGGLFFSAEGDELKQFSILDGLGIKLMREAGIGCAWITGRDSPLTSRRAHDLRIDHLVQGREDKRIALQELLKETGLSPQQVAYIGDDLPDLGAVELAGLGCTVANGHWLLRARADLVTATCGGQGAVRELCEQILHSRGLLLPLLRKFHGGSQA